VLLPFVAAIVFLGVYPKPVLERMEPAIDALVEHVDEGAPQFTAPETPEPAPVAEAAEDEGH
jgi:NADH-quinone oxidoreductase subunit M